MKELLKALDRLTDKIMGYKPDKEKRKKKKAKKSQGKDT